MRLTIRDSKSEVGQYVRIWQRDRVVAIPARMIPYFSHG